MKQQNRRRGKKDLVTLFRTDEVPVTTIIMVRHITAEREGENDSN